MSDNIIGRANLNKTRKFQKPKGTTQQQELGGNKQQTGIGSQRESFLKSVTDSKLGGYSNMAGLAAVGLGATSLATFGPAMGMGMATGAVLGAIAGVIGVGLGASLAAMGAKAFPKTEGVTISPSGIEQRTKGDQTKISLPDGTKIKHSKGKDGITGLSARDADGNKLKAEVVRDGESGNEQIRLKDENGKVTTYNPANMELNFSGKTPGEKGVLAKQTVRADGSMQFIVDERSSHTTERQENPLNKGEFQNVQIPLSHAYTQVDLTADGDSSVSQVSETYSLKGKSGALTSARKGFTDWVAAQTQEQLSTNLNTGEAISISKADSGKLKSGLKTAIGFMGSAVGGPIGASLSYSDQPLEFTPFLTRNDMKDAHTQLVESRLDEMAKGMKEAVAVKSPNGETVLADMGGKNLRVFDENGNKTRSVRYNAGLASTPISDGQNIITVDKHNKIRGLGTHGSQWKAELGGDMLAEPTFNKDGDVVVLVDKDSRIAAKTFSPKGELKEAKLLKGDPADLRTPEQVKAREERAERKEFLNFAREGLNAEDASIPQMAKMVGMDIAMNTDVLEVAGDNGVSLMGDPIKSLAEGGKENSGLQDTMEKAFVDYLNTDEGGDKFFKAAHANNPDMRPKPREGSSMAGMLENMERAAEPESMPLAERKMLDYLARNADTKPAESKSPSIVDGNRVFPGSTEEYTKLFKNFLGS